MRDYECLLGEVEEAHGIARLVLDRPKRRNALNRTLVEELKDALAGMVSDARVRVVALSGAGEDFCAGADLREIQAAGEEGVEAGLADADALGELFLLMRRCPKPIVALVTGRALAGGCGLATACDLVLAAESAKFGYPEVHLGFVPAMVMVMLRRAMGERQALELVALGDTVDAERARDLGLVNRVFPEAEFEAATREYLEELATRSASAVSLCKRLLYQIDGIGFEAAIRRGAEVNALARLTEDCREGVRRFLDR
ncbi:MAG: enoyl-CoA hydratase/isomerase family protein [Gemmatimonadota bacterium]